MKPQEDTNNRKTVIDTGKLGYIEFIIAVKKEAYKRIHKFYSAEMEASDRAKLDKELKDGIYRIE